MMPTMTLTPPPWTRRLAAGALVLGLALAASAAPASAGNQPESPPCLPSTSCPNDQVPTPGGWDLDNLKRLAKSCNGNGGVARNPTTGDYGSGVECWPA